MQVMAPSLSLFGVIMKAAYQLTTYWVIGFVIWSGPCRSLLHMYMGQRAGGATMGRSAATGV